MNFLNPKIQEYIENIIPERKEPFVKMEAYAKENNFPIIGALVGTLLKQLTISLKAKNIFELGSGFGYSGLWMAEALSDEGKVYLTDRKETNKQKAIEYFSEAGQIDKMEFHVGDAIEIFEKHKGPFDIIVNDIDKENYPATIALVKERLRQGGIFITDNILWSGRIFDENPADHTKGILEFTRQIYADPDFITSILPLRDGITVSVKL